jgi:hypothetical protein
MNEPIAAELVPHEPVPPTDQPTGQPMGRATEPLLDRDVALVDVLDRVLAGGVVVSGELTLSIADVDLVHISLRTLLSSITALRPPP